MLYRVVRLHVEVSSADESDLCTVLQARGWVCRSTAEPPSTLPNSRVVRVDAHVRGAKVTAVRRAVDELRVTARRAGLDIVARTALIPHPMEAPLHLFFIYRHRPAPSLRLLQATENLLVRTGLRDVGAFVYGATLQDAEKEMQRLQPELEHDIRPDEDLRLRRSALDSATNDSRQPAMRRGQQTYGFSSFILLMLGALAYLLSVRIGSGPELPARILAPLISMIVIVFICSTWRMIHVLRSAALGVTINVVAIAIAVPFGFLHGNATGPGTAQSLVYTVGFLGVGALGVFRLLQNPPVRRAALWIVPVGLSFVLPTAAVLGQWTYLAYLEQFNLGTSDVQVDPLNDAAAALYPLFGLLICVTLAIGAAGWTNYFHAGKALIVVPILILVSITPVWLNKTIGVGVTEANSMRQAASEGNNLPRFLGMKPRPVCVQPLGGTVHALGDALVTDHPMVMLGEGNNRAALWDARTNGTVRVELVDVTVLDVNSLKSICPSIGMNPAR